MLNVLLWTQATVATVWVAAEAWQARRRRPEPDGGVSERTDAPAAVLRRDPLPPPGPSTEGESGDAPARAPVPSSGGPLEAHVLVTRDCGLPCPSCHVQPTAGGPHVDLETLDARFAALAADGVLRVALGGGEVLRHPELEQLAERARAHGLAIGATTSGTGDAERLIGFDQVNVSLDGVGAVYTRARGYAGAERALATIRELSARGVHVGVNVVLDRHTLPALHDTVDAAVAAGARDVQLLRLKPVGRAAADYVDRCLTPTQGLAVWPTARALLERHPGVTVRIDCALFPFLAAHDPDPVRLEQFALRGCYGGDDLVSVDFTGARHPCSFDAGPVDPRWLDGVAAAPCDTCAYRGPCRGGCHAVAHHLVQDRLAPDPECPRVLAAGQAT